MATKNQNPEAESKKEGEQAPVIVSDEFGLSVTDLKKVITIKQIPIIEEQLEILHVEILKKTEALMVMQPTEETLVAIKNARAWNNKLKNQIKSLLDEIISELAEPINNLKKKINEDIMAPLKEADEASKKKIVEVEDGIKDRTRIELEKYFNEYAALSNVPDVTLANTGINIIRSVTMINLKKQAKGWIDRVSGELATISLLPHTDEILAEYKNDYDLGRASKVISERYADIEKAKKQREEREEAERQRNAHEVKVENVIEQQAKENILNKVKNDDCYQIPLATEYPVPTTAPPISGKDASETCEAVFAIIDTIEAIRKVKEFMNKEGIHYESR